MHPIQRCGFSNIHLRLVSPLKCRFTMGKTDQFLGIDCDNISATAFRTAKCGSTESHAVLRCSAAPVFRHV